MSNLSVCRSVGEWVLSLLFGASDDFSCTLGHSPSTVRLNSVCLRTHSHPWHRVFVCSLLEHRFEARDCDYWVNSSCVCPQCAPDKNCVVVQRSGAPITTATPLRKCSIGACTVRYTHTIQNWRIWEIYAPCVVPLDRKGRRTNHLASKIIHAKSM